MADILTTATDAGQFRTLIGAVEAAGLAETLRGAGPYTVFAPTDAAFARLLPGSVDRLLRAENRGELASLIQSHVLPGKVMAHHLFSLTETATVQDGRSGVDIHHGVKVDGATVIKTDIECDNGVIHVVDAVIGTG